jgi:hypothetical protein
MRVLGAVTLGLRRMLRLNLKYGVFSDWLEKVALTRKNVFVSLSL